MKIILVIFYSQTGQLKEILTNFLKPWNVMHHVDFVEIKSKDFSFPMSYKQFFDAFPETILKHPCKITYEIEWKDYDCVIIGFQSWFLHTSIPFNSFMQTEEFKKAVSRKPVFLVMDSRNTWRNTMQDTRYLGKHGIRKAVEQIFQSLKKHQITSGEIDYLLPHVSSMYFFDQLKAGLAEAGEPFADEKWFINLREVGNVGSASIYLMLEQLFSSGNLMPGQKLFVFNPESGRFMFSTMLLTVV